MEPKYFGHFLLLELLQRDIGELWRARGQVEEERDVWLKIFKADTTPPFIDREVIALQGIRHECVCRLIDSGSAEGRRYLLFESLEGYFLRDKLKAKKDGFAFEEALPIFDDVLRGLLGIHENFIVHRDLKPDNIFITTSGRAILTDFSLAKLGSITEGARPDLDTQEGETFGTPPYMSPEQWRGASGVDSRTDLYAFGILLYEMLTGSLPFTEQSPASLYDAHSNSEPPSLLSARPELPKAIEVVYRRLLAKNRDERYRTAQEVVADLRRIQGVSNSTTVFSASRFCPKCRAELTTDDAFSYSCANCRTSWEDKSFLMCRSCRVYTPGGYSYCIHCGVDNRLVNETIEVPLSEAVQIESGSTESSVSVDVYSPHSMHWSAIATHAVFGDAPERRAELAAAPSFISQAAPGSQYLSEAVRTPTLSPGFEEKESATRSGHILSAGMKLLGRYRILKHIGTGGFATIYLAFDELLDEEIAVKVPFYGESHPMARVFKSQLKAWKVLSDKNPVRVVKLFNAEQVRSRGLDLFCIFMEYMSGGSLAEMVANKWKGSPRNPDEMSKLLRLFLQACRAISFLHSNNALHRDIKPANMLLDATHSICKLSDFELVDTRKDGEQTQSILGGTPVYMAPECVEGRFSEASDIFSLGVTIYQLLSGKMPFKVEHFYDTRRPPPPDLTRLNPLVSSELQQVVLRCLEPNPEHRPQGVEDLIADLAYIGISDQEASAAPVNLAQLLLTYLNDEEKEYLTQTLTEDQGFRSARKATTERQADLIQEYCYTASPHDVLANNFTSRQLATIAQSMGLKKAAGKPREELISEILDAVGFLPGPQIIPGIETTRSFLESQLMSLAHTTNSDECSGMALSGLATVERAVDWIVGFYGQLFYGSGFDAFLSRQIQSKGKPIRLMSFGEKVKALRVLCSDRPPMPLPHRIQQVFDWPIIPNKIFNQLDALVAKRNELAHRMERRGFYDAQRSARQVISTAVEVVADLANNNFIPRIVQIISRQDDVYGRHFYLGRDDRGHSERIFTPLALTVGQLYLFYPLTNPARINPLIFPYDSHKKGNERSGKHTSSGRSANKKQGDD